MESLTFVWHLGPFTNLNWTCGIEMDYVLVRIVKVRLQVGNLQFVLFLPRFHCKWTKTNGSPALLSNQIMQKNEIVSFTLNIFSSDKYLTLMLVIKMVGNHATNINSFRYVSLLFLVITGEPIHLYQLIQMTVLYAVTSGRSCLKLSRHQWGSFDSGPFLQCVLIEMTCV